jgi:hypothetical protein
MLGQRKPSGWHEQKHPCTSHAGSLHLLGFGSGAPRFAANQLIELLPGMGDLHHPIATSSPAAQRFFDQ